MKEDKSDKEKKICIFEVKKQRYIKGIKGCDG